MAKKSGNKTTGMEVHAPGAVAPTGSLIDFTELAALGVKGEGLEALAERLLTHLGCIVNRSGRGADGGKDLFAVERIPSDVAPYQRTWLVQCKDFAKSKRAVNENDVGSILDLCRKHDATGYLLITTTGPTKELGELMERISASKEDALVAACWDSHSLRRLLHLPETAPILREFLPNSYRRLQKLEPEAAFLEALKERGYASVIIEGIRALLSQSVASGISSNDIFPYPTAHRGKMEQALDAFIKNNQEIFTSSLESLPLEEWTAIIGAVRQENVDFALDALRGLASSAGSEDLRFQAVRTILRDFRCSFEEVLKFAGGLDHESLSILLSDLGLDRRLTEAVTSYVFDSSGMLFEELPHPIVSEVVTDAPVYDTSAAPDNLKVTVHFEVGIEYDFGGGDGPSPGGTFPGNATATIWADGKIELVDLTVDTSSFFQ